MINSFIQSLSVKSKCWILWDLESNVIIGNQYEMVLRLQNSSLYVREALENQFHEGKAFAGHLMENHGWV